MSHTDVAHALPSPVMHALCCRLRSSADTSVRRLTFLALFVLGTCNAEPTVPDTLRDAIDRGMQAGIYHDIAAGWIDGAQRATSFFGQSSAESTFEIGAATEIFTDLLFAQAAIEGKLRLQSSLKDLLPDLAFADSALGATTLESLATHRAGLPAMPPNLMPLDVDDPYAQFSERELRAFLANFRLPRVSGDYAYSVLDAGLLGFLLSRSYATGFEKLLHEKVLAPLGMKRAAFDDEHLLGGHARGESVAHWHFGALSGSAGLRTTLNELMDFMQVNLRPEGSPLRAALLLVRQPRARVTGGEFSLGWNIREVESDGQTWPLLWRASTTAGFSSFIGFRTDHQQALVLLGNSDSDLSALGMAILEGKALSATPHRRTELQAAQVHVQDYTGLYQVRGGMDIVIRERDQQLFAQLQGDQSARLSAYGDDVFEAVAEGYTISFQREAGSVNSLLLARAGVNLLAQRLSTRAPHVTRQALEVDARQLGEFAGDYQVSPDSLARVSAAQGLSMQLTGRTPLALKPFAADRFACVDESCEVVFMRDAAAAVTGARIDFAGGVHEAPRVRWSTP